MVNFSVFNELSLPLNDIQEFEEFFKLLSQIRELGLEKIRMDREFTQYPEILPSITFQQLIGQISDKNKKRRLLSFLKNGISVIESPLIFDNEEEKEQLLENEYFYNGSVTIGGLACCDIWNTIAISFNSKEEWNRDKIILQKQTILDEKEININIQHASKVEHLNMHQNFFEELTKDIKLGITKNNFWEQREEFFPEKIIFCKEVKKQIKNLDTLIFQQVISILRDIESNKKKPTDYDYSGEKETVKTNPKMIAERKFTIDNKKVFFENHIKSLSNAHRIYLLEQGNKIYIGYIGKHLTNKHDN